MHNDEIEKKFWSKGKFLMLHPDLYTTDDKPHPDRGRIGEIIDATGEMCIVSFTQDDLVGAGKFCILPRNCWCPIPEFMCEVYEVRAKKMAIRLTPRGQQIAKGMNWKFTKLSTGEKL